MKKTKVAVIGCGTIANNAHIPSYLKNPDVEIKWFCDIIPERADGAVEKYGCGKAVYDYHEILDDPELDAVSVCTPNNVHAPITIDFLNAGKNVLCEKPAARTYNEALTMLDAQHKTGKVLNIGVVNRFNDGVNQIKKRIDAGELGEIYQVYVSFRDYRCIPGLGGAFTDKSIAGGGVLIDWGVHFFDIVMYCCNDPKPLTVTAETHCKLAKNISEYKYHSMWAGPPKLDGICDVEEFVTGMIRTEGPTITLNGAWAQNINQKEMFIDFIGTKGGIRLQYGGNFKLYDSDLNTTEPEYPSKNHFENELNAFVECIHSGEKLPSHIDTNIITSKIMQAIYDSAESHREIAFE
ncbi:MAG: Gfo/Idh/MocA family oxidoreductase [Ruminococcaceae bacterium]|nr:Gfo/Idh/MocA family oxidoreductase [Oscillospiraceae bacterium]